MTEAKKDDGLDRRICQLRKSGIVIGKGKVGRVVFPGGVCFDCYRKTKAKMFK